MAEESKAGAVPALTSEWGGLSPHLIATFFAVKKVKDEKSQNYRWVRDLDQPEVRAPITDAHISAQLNWQSPFENMGPDQQMATASGLIQSGGFTATMEALRAAVGSNAVTDYASQSAASLEGRSNMTKLNSTQVLNGMGPLTMPMTLHFRAWKDAAAEVQRPMGQIMEWALPRKIAEDGVLTAAMSGNLRLFPSEIPQIVGMKFAGMLVAPMVIESPTYPLDGPRDRNGILTRAAMTIQLSSLTALDKSDWATAWDPGNRKTFNY